MPAGRPKIDINKEEFERLCAMQCTCVEIGNFFGCCHDVVEQWCKREYGKTFEKVFAEKRSPGLVSLRRSQFAMADKNVAMAIWLGKQYLGQRDNLNVNNASEVEDDPLTKSIKDGLNGLQ